MSTPTAPADSGLLGKTHYKILGLMGLTHFLNDATQSLLVPVYPLFKETFSLTFTGWWRYVCHIFVTSLIRYLVNSLLFGLEQVDNRLDQLVGLLPRAFVWRLDGGQT